jgi:hypothetical protein
VTVLKSAVRAGCETFVPCVWRVGSHQKRWRHTLALPRLRTPPRPRLQERMRKRASGVRSVDGGGSLEVRSTRGIRADMAGSRRATFIFFPRKVFVTFRPAKVGMVECVRDGNRAGVISGLSRADTGPYPSSSSSSSSIWSSKSSSSALMAHSTSCAQSQNHTSEDAAQAVPEPACRSPAFQEPVFMEIDRHALPLTTV